MLCEWPVLPLERLQCTPSDADSTHATCYMHTERPGKMRLARFCPTSVQHIMPAQQSLVTMKPADV